MEEDAASRRCITLLMASRLEADCLSVYLASRVRSLSRITHITDPKMTDQDRTLLAGVVILDTNFCEASRIPRLVFRLAQEKRRVILLADANQRDVVHAAALAGVYSAFSLEDPLAGLVDQIDAVLSGRSWGQYLTGNQWSAALAHDTNGLTAREAEIVTLYAGDAGQTVIEIGDALGISVNTVRAHLANVRKKLGGAPTKNTLALRTALVEKGWLPEWSEATRN